MRFGNRHVDIELSGGHRVVERRDYGWLARRHCRIDIQPDLRDGGILHACSLFRHDRGADIQIRVQREFRSRLHDHAIDIQPDVNVSELRIDERVSAGVAGCHRYPVAHFERALLPAVHQQRILPSGLPARIARVANREVHLISRVVLCIRCQSGAEQRRGHDPS